MGNDITSQELFGRVEEAMQAEGTARNRILHETLELLCRHGLQESRHGFGNLSSQLDALCRRYGIGQADVAAMHDMRRHGNSAAVLSEEAFLYDCRALCLLVSAVFGCQVPASLTARIPHHRRPVADRNRVDTKYIRCTVRSWDDQALLVTADAEGCGEPLRVLYRDVPEYVDLGYLPSVLREGMQLNLLDNRLSGRDVVPGLVVVEPDYLIDISSLANCFEEYGHHPLLFTLNRLLPRPNNRHTLLGNFAGSALDDIINNPDSQVADTLRGNFREKALEFCTCDDFDPVVFKHEAARQAAHLRQIVDDLFTRYDRSRALLEPSFVCERLGLQGRVDLMTSDLRLLVEQKAGKNMFLERAAPNRHGSYHVEKHYVQVLLYAGVLSYNMGRQPDVHLLYSRYPLPAGLLEVQWLRQLFREALDLRNLIVAQEFRMAQEGFATVLPQLCPEVLNTTGMTGFFYERYLQPRLQEATAPLHQLPPLEKAYLCRMATFVIREQLLQKVGGSNDNGHSAASLWSMPLSEKRETGNIYTGLTIEEKSRSTDANGYDTISLRVPDQGDGFLPNFRRGDLVYLYAYPEAREPDARQAVLFKGVVAQTAVHRLTLHLTDGQQNQQVFHEAGDGYSYAVEHAGSDIGSSAALGSLRLFATADASRRALLLGQRAPRHDASLRLSRSYHPSCDPMLALARQAQDYFLLVGPPGTGKTSMALRFLVEEELAAAADRCVLLMAYTNRAVDEICGMLQAAGHGFLRLGSEYSCDPRYADNLLSHALGPSPRLEAVRSRLLSTRVITATTSALLSRPFLLSLKRFSLAIVDEASQILEPGLVGLLSHPSVGRFVLVGDHKQLSAVVQQTAVEAAVNDPLLQAIGLTDCRQSLFERLLRWERHEGRTRFTATLQRQGRMHPGVADWPSRMFYGREQLQPVPLAHQQETAVYPQPLPANVPDDGLTRLLLAHRLLFVASEDCRRPDLSDKVNTSEALITARLLARVRQLYGPAFDASATVGVIVPYRNQIAMIREEIDRLGMPELHNVSIDTVERYQGSQRDVIVYSFTVQRRSQLAFLTANTFVEDGHPIDRKLNVALTRARRQTLLTGNPRVLACHPLFSRLMEDIRQTGGYREQI